MDHWHAEEVETVTELVLEALPSFWEWHQNGEPEAKPRKGGRPRGVDAKEIVGFVDECKADRKQMKNIMAEWNKTHEKQYKKLGTIEQAYRDAKEYLEKHRE